MNTKDRSTMAAILHRERDAVLRDIKKQMQGVKVLDQLLATIGNPDVEADDPAASTGNGHRPVRHRKWRGTVKSTLLAAVAKNGPYDDRASLVRDAMALAPVKTPRKVFRAGISTLVYNGFLTQTPDGVIALAPQQ